LEIAREFTNKIFIRPHRGAPEPHRPFSFEQAKNQWILQLDADEYLDKDFRDALPELITRNVSGYKVNWVEEVNGTRFVNMCKEVLFQKKRVFFIGAPCEYVKPVKIGDDLVMVPVSLVNKAEISNYGPWEFFVGKYKKFAQLQAECYCTDFSLLAAWNYPEHNWEKRTLLKIHHPILLGIIGMNVKYIIELIKTKLGFSSDISPGAALHLMWYNTVVYWNVLKRTYHI
jgi:hypothetical protein